MLAWERQKRLQDKHNYAKELDNLRNFDFDEWRKRVSWKIVKSAVRVEECR